MRYVLRNKISKIVYEIANHSFHDLDISIDFLENRIAKIIIIMLLEIKRIEKESLKDMKRDKCKLSEYLLIRWFTKRIINGVKKNG